MRRRALVALIGGGLGACLGVCLGAAGPSVAAAQVDAGTSAPGAGTSAPDAGTADAGPAAADPAPTGAASPADAVQGAPAPGERPGGPPAGGSHAAPDPGPDGPDAEDGHDAQEAEADRADADRADAAPSTPDDPFTAPTEGSRADTPPDAPTNGGSTEAREEGQDPSIERRRVPNYDGREPTGPTPEEALLWIPRVLFYPVHLVMEYVFRQPIGWFITTMERERWFELFIDFFTFDERKVGVVPTAFFDFGFQPSGGIYVWWNEAGFEENSLRAQIGFGGIDWLRATVTDRVRTSDETEMGLTVDTWRRPDQLFDGIGWDSQRTDRSRYIRSYVQGRYDFQFRPWRASEIRFAMGVTWNDFEPGGYVFGAEQEPCLGEAVAQGTYPLPAGFGGYTAYHQRLDVAIDTREPRPAPGHGVRIEGHADLGFDLTSAIERRWMRYGGAVGGFVDLSDNRVLSLSGRAHFVDALGTSGPVPFIELVQLGGEPLVMSGFQGGALRGQSAVAATLEYRYPIWVFLDGSVHLSVGNVFGDRLNDFDVERLRLSFGVGLRSIGDRDQSLNILVAFGSTPFVEGASIDSVRLVIGSQQGF